jgi:hypothetical protein
MLSILWDTKKFILLTIFFLLGNVQLSNAFTSSGTCQNVLNDYLKLTNKSGFIDANLTGFCVVNHEKDLKQVLQNGGYIFKEKQSVIQVKQRADKQISTSTWKPGVKKFKVKFLFVNLSSLLDCGIKLNDILATLYNTEITATIGASVGCPALDYDGSFRFVGNVAFTDKWEFSQGTESQKIRTQITTSTGAVSTQYEDYTTGFTLVLRQLENSLNYELTYIGSNGSKTHNYGEFIQQVNIDVWNDYEEIRKLWFIPLGIERKRDTYKFILHLIEN